jgi:hypothetical protein
MSVIRNPQFAIRNPREPTLQERFRELNDTSSREAATLAAQGERLSVWKLVFRPFSAFVQAYAWQGQWRQGVAGLVTALFSSYAVFVRYAKLWEHRKLKPADPPPES